MISGDPLMCRLRNVARLLSVLIPAVFIPAS
jgi:hypothetical protein